MIMRYKKGSKVEVLEKNEAPSVFWRCAEIRSGNGHNYTVKFECHNATKETIVERVSRKSIRPCPPPLHPLGNWISGDVVEVFLNFSWKMATVSKVLDGNSFLVRLLGSFQEFEVTKFDLRVRQSWQGDKWIIIGNGSGNGKDGKHSEQSTLVHNQNLSSQVEHTDTNMNLCEKDDLFSANKYLLSRTLKREHPYCYSQVEAHAGTAKKHKVIEKEGRRHWFLAATPSPSPEKVDTAASPRELLGEKQIFASINNRTTRFSKMDVERENSNGAVGCSHVISLECNHAHNVTCSVGSCSITSNNSFKLPCQFSVAPVEDTEDHLSDVESACRCGYDEGNCLLPTKEEMAAEIHRLELHAYHCTMEALHALGPLSWEQETLVTNLRLSLHISNDEHLMEGQSRRLVHLDSKCLKVMLRFVTFLLMQTIVRIKLATNRTAYDDRLV
ncbi:uncharacterized protein LOC132277264 [Cornus florida]|uniref:uncharacterized protein LOC132277264 n=1 Tax=Cornus florida TaxID=4283 RepID=UPI0028970BCB|nr:uncharacterized protein LOC132277264 [Cornus florida]